VEAFSAGLNRTRSPAKFFKPDVRRWLIRAIPNNLSAELVGRLLFRQWVERAGNCIPTFSKVLCQVSQADDHIPGRVALMNALSIVTTENSAPPTPGAVPPTGPLPFLPCFDRNARV
jgi:hypothetical protein